MNYQKVKYVLFALLVLLSLSGCQSIWYLFLNTFVDVAPDRFTIQENDRRLSIPIYTSHPLTADNDALAYLVIMIHGAGLNAGKAFAIGQKTADLLTMAHHRIMVIAPQFLEGMKPDEEGSLLWNRLWRSGGASIPCDLNEDLPRLTSFAVLDKLIAAVTRRNPGLRRVLIMGHSAGGQFVLRYAAMNNHHETWQGQGVFLQYVVANASSYLYLDERRFQLGTHGEIVETAQSGLRRCPNYNHYKYGLEEMYGYAENITPEHIRVRLLTRPILFLIGAKDTGRGWGLDKACEGEMQGENRYERGVLYRHHLGQLVKNAPGPPHIWLEISNVGHNSTEMFNHPNFIKKLKTLNF